MNRTAKQILIDWLKANPGWHKKSAMTDDIRFAYDDKHANFTADTIAPKLREAVREGKIDRREVDGRAEYAALGTFNDRPECPVSPKTAPSEPNVMKWDYVPVKNAEGKIISMKPIRV